MRIAVFLQNTHSFLNIHGIKVTSWMLFIGVIVLRIAHLLTSADDPYLQYRIGDEQHYHDWAMRIVAGDWQRGSAFFTNPLYAYFLALQYSLGLDQPSAIRCVNALLGFGSFFLVFLISRDFFRGWTRLIAPALVGFCAAPLFYESFAEKTTLVLFLTSLAFYALSRAMNHQRYRDWFLAGIACGISAIGHGLLLVLLMVLMTSILSVHWRSWKSMTKSVSVALLGSLIALSPTILHNLSQEGEFVLITANSGQNFYIGNHKGNLTGKYTSPPFSVSNLKYEEGNFHQEAERRTDQRLSSAQASSFWFGEGLREIRQMPELALKRYWRKLRWSLGYREITDSRTYEFYKERLPVLGLPLWGFGLVSLCGLIGGLLTLTRPKLQPNHLFIMLYCGAIALFFVFGRYRLPLIIPLSLLAAGGFELLWQNARSRSWSRLLGGAICCIAVGWFVYGEVLPNDEVSFFTDYYNQGNRYLNQGRITDAIDEYDKALTKRPGNHPAIPMLVTGLADLHFQRGDQEHGIYVLRRALLADPTNQMYREKLRQLSLQP